MHKHPNDRQIKGKHAFISLVSDEQVILSLITF